MTAGRSTESNPRTSRRRAAAFVLVSLALSWAWDVWIITHGGMARIWAVGLAMWIPGLTSLGLRLVTGEGLGDVAWKPGPGAAWAWACLAPAACAALTYALAVSLGIVHFGQPATLGPLPLPTDSALLAW